MEKKEREWRDREDDAIFRDVDKLVHTQKEEKEEEKGRDKTEDEYIRTCE